MDATLLVVTILLIAYVWGLRGRLRRSESNWAEIEKRWAELTRRIHTLEQHAPRMPEHERKAAEEREGVVPRLDPQMERQPHPPHTSEPPPIERVHADPLEPVPPAVESPGGVRIHNVTVPSEVSKPTPIPSRPVIPPAPPIPPAPTPLPPAAKPPSVPPHVGPKPVVPPPVQRPLPHAAAHHPAVGGMLGLGIRFEENANWRNFARTGIGGGWALLYVTTYAMHHMEAARVIDSEALDLVLMLLVAATMVAHTLKYRSQLVTGFAFLLPFFTVGMTMVLAPLSASGVRSANLSTSVILAVGLVVLVNRMRWYELEVFGILAAYVMHLFWLVPIEMRVGQHHVFPELTSSTVLLFLYWLIFRASYLVRRVEEKGEENVSTLAALLNTFLFQGINWYQGAHPELAWKFFLGVGIAEIAFGILPMARRRRPAFLILTTIGATLLMLSAVSYPSISANSLSLMWLVEAEALFLAGVFTREIQFRRLGSLAAMLVAGKLFLFDAVHLESLRVDHSSPLTDWRLAVTFAIAALAFYADANLIPRKSPEVGATKFEAASLEFLSYAAALAGGAAIWAGLTEQWVAVGWGAMAVVLAFGGRIWNFNSLRNQAHAAAAAAFLRAMIVNYPVQSFGHHNAQRLLTVGLVAGSLYIASRWAYKETAEQKRGYAALYTWAGTILAWGLIFAELNQKYVAVAWLIGALALAVVGGWARLREMSYQAYAVAGAGFFAALSFNILGSAAPAHVFNRERLILVLMAAALLYICAGWAGVTGVSQAAPIAAGHTWAGSILVAFLAAFELDWGWVGLAWSVNALVLYGLARRLKKSELYYQAHVLAVASLPMAIFAGPGHSALGVWDGALMLKLGLPAAVIYLSADQCHRFEQANAKPGGIAYLLTWGGSLMTGVLIWYELPAVSVAVGWGVLALVLFELGLTRASASWRFQGYVALTAAFVRLWFANFNVPGWERVYTTLPLALAFYYVHERVHGEAKDSLQKDLAWRTARLPGVFGTVTLAALIYFALPDVLGADWVIAGWAALALALTLVSGLERKSIYLSHAVGVGLAVVYWGIAYNFAQASHYDLSLRAGLASRVGGAAGLMLLALPAAFRHRRIALAESAAKRGSIARAFAALERHPQQFFFFAPVVLITVLLWRIFPGMLTVAWGLEAVAVFVFGLWVGERSFRLTGMGLLLTCVGRILLDIRKLSLPGIIVTLAVMAAATFVVSWLWTRYREALRRYL